MKNTILKIVQSLLVAERNNNIIHAEKKYKKLQDFCEKNNINFNNALNGAKKHLSFKISNIMQGI